MQFLTMTTFNCILVAIVVCVFPLQIATEADLGQALYPISKDVQFAISKQVSYELTASVEYLAMAAYFGQDDVALQGFKKFFMEKSDKKQDHTKKLVQFLNNRNGKLEEIKIERIAFTGSTAVVAIDHALKLENKLLSHLMVLHKLAQTTNDVNLIHALENGQLLEQIATTRTLTGLSSKLRRISNNNNSRIGEYLIDREWSEEH